ncbi:MAG: 30S ribosomal protein S13 [Candidatus Woesearchaeota archaeon]
MAEKTNQELRPMVRILNSDLDGNKTIWISLKRIKGISFTFANVICNSLNLDKSKKVGYLSDEEIKKIENIISNPLEHSLKPWLLNRRKDYETGSDLHLHGINLGLSKDFDIKNMKKIKAYKGIRHQQGQPVRGQRTKAHFRKGASLGVSRRPGAKAGK